MHNILRIKGISSALGIRRSAVAYNKIINEDVILDSAEYPLKNVGYKLECLNDKYSLIYKDNKIDLELGKEEYFQATRKVKSFDKEIDEYIEIRFMLIPLDLNAIPYYKDCISNGYLFDEKNGEFSYLIGLIYEEFGNIQDAKLYFEEAKKLGFC